MYQKAFQCDEAIQLDSSRHRDKSVSGGHDELTAKDVSQFQILDQHTGHADESRRAGRRSIDGR
jgi:hypothetical protein